MPTEPVDLFADAFQVNVFPFSSKLTFSLSSAELRPDQVAPGELLPTTRIATIRMTPELMKGLVFLAHQEILKYEREGGARIQLPKDVMARIQTTTGKTQEQWDRFWGYT